MTRCDAQNFDVPPPPNGELVLVLLPNAPPPVLLDWPKMLPEVFVFDPKPGDAEGELERLDRYRGGAHRFGAHRRPQREGEGEGKVPKPSEEKECALT